MSTSDIKRLEKNVERELTRWAKNPTNVNEARLSTSEGKLAKARMIESGEAQYAAMKGEKK
jgi:hypothetical protein